MPSQCGSDPLPVLERDRLAAHVNGVAGGTLSTLVGLDLAALRDVLTQAPDRARHVLLLDLATAATADVAIVRILDDLADLALAAWPDWSPAPEHAPDRARPWRRAAERLAAAGLPPRFRRLSGSIELANLVGLLDPRGLVLASAVDPARLGSAAAAIAALEWAARHGAAVVVLLASRPIPFAPYDRILHGALEITAALVPAASRTIFPSVPAPGGSATERIVRRALARDAELGPLFESEVTLRLGPLQRAPRVDLCWREGRVVVELDGPEHFGDPIYGLDRHRDYELLAAGYLVLRLTNAQIATDLPQAIEKIRNVVRLRKTERDRG